MKNSALRTIFILTMAAGIVYYVHIESGSDPLSFGAAVTAWVVLVIYLLLNLRKEIREGPKESRRSSCIT